MGINLPSARTLGCVVWPGITHSQGVPPDFHPPHVNVGPPMPIPLPLHTTRCLLASLPHLLISSPTTHLDKCGFFKSLVVRLPHSSIFWQLWTLLVWGFSCNSFYGCARRWSVSTYTSILTGNESQLFSNPYVIIPKCMWYLNLFVMLALSLHTVFFLACEQVL